MTRFVILKRAGEPGKVAVNPDMVTEVRSSSGPFIDIHFGDHRVAVEGTLQQVVGLLSSSEQGARGPSRDTPAPEGWLTAPPTNWR